jgi:hypothetical protein
MPTFKGCSVGNAERPKIVQAAGIPDFSTNAFSSSACPKITP